MRATSFFFYESEEEIMILSNVGTKIINIGSTVLMPGDNMKISAETAKLPAIEAFKEMGFVAVIGEETAPTAEPAAEENAADETTTAKRRGRKPASEEAPQE